MKIQLTGLEYHCTHACNLSCQSCSHYSNHHHGSFVPLEQADREMKLWNNDIHPLRFSILGGEPALHPQLEEFVVLARKNWPNSDIGVTSNGIWLYQKHPNLWKVMSEQNANLTISQHSRDPAYLEKFDPALKKIQNMCAKYKVPLRILKSMDGWRHQYFGYGDTMMPYQDNDPSQSWTKCRAKKCVTLFEGKLWKCPPLAFLKLQKAKFNLDPIWDQYLDYENTDVLLSGKTHEEIKNWLDKKEEKYCSMCPANPKILDLPNPLEPHPLLKICEQKDAPLPGENRSKYVIKEIEIKML
jgi:uncharacterized Fe-S cluster-containing radical SAM superfamily protein